MAAENISTEEENDLFHRELADTIERDLVRFGDISKETRNFWELMGNSSDSIRRIERHLDLPLTGEWAKLIRNYIETRYTIESFERGSPVQFCFQEAIKYSHAEGLRRALQYPGITSDQIRTGIIRVTTAGCLESMKVLLEHLNFPPTFRQGRYEAAYVAAAYGRVNIIQFLIQTYPRSELPIKLMMEIASEKGQLEAVQYLVDVMESDKHSIAGPGLRVAVKHDQIAIVEFLAQHMLRMDLTPIFINLCAHGNLKMIPILIVQMQDWTISSGFGKAIANREFEVARYLSAWKIPSFEIREALIVTAKHGQMDLCSHLAPMASSIDRISLLKSISGGELRTILFESLTLTGWLLDLLS